MKKLTAVFLTLALLLTLSAAALAEENVGDGVVVADSDGTFTDSDSSMEVKFSVDESYKVTIPSEITLTGSGDTKSFSPTITATTNFKPGKYLSVYLGNDGWTDISYTLHNGTTVDELPANPLVKSFSFKPASAAFNMTVAKANGGNFTPATGNNAASVLDTETVTEKSETLTFTADTKGLPADSYSYTQTFHISVLGS